MNDGPSSHEERSGNGFGHADPREPWFERVLHRFGLRSRDSIRTDLEDVLASTAEDAGFSPQERAMLKNVLRFHRIRVYDVMVPRADIVAASAETSLGEMLRIFRTAGHSRLPVYGETLDDPKGMVHIRDFLDYLVARAENGGTRRRSRAAQALSLGNIDLSVSLASAKILRPVLFVPPSMPAVELLVRMQTTRTHMALVIDEYGGTDGLVSIEDLVEMVVGDIEDEHDLETAAMIAPSEGDTYVADARADLEEVSQAIGINLLAADVAEEVDTLGGLIVTIAGRVPTRSELIAGPEGLEFEVLDADPRRLKRIRIHRRDPSVKLHARPETISLGDRAEPAAGSDASSSVPSSEASSGANTGMIAAEPSPLPEPPANPDAPEPNHLPDLPSPVPDPPERKPSA
jgi:CBS domain containing-hemolysin-like protein